MNGTIWLGYASLLEDVWSYCFGKPPELFPPEFQRIRVPLLREVYSTALVMGFTNSVRTSRGLIAEDSSVAAAALVRLEKAAKPSLTAEQFEALSEFVWKAGWGRAAESRPTECSGGAFWPERFEEPHLSPAELPVPDQSDFF
jgi:hypothetical protein